MKQVCVFLLLLIVPNICLALTDACTNPEKHIVDKRCYVTSDEILDFPYNKIVKIGDVVTGTIVGSNTILTCRSCVNPEKYSTNHGPITFYTSDGKQHVAKVVIMPTEQDSASEWAVLKTDDAFNGPFLQVLDYADDAGVSQIGYSALKILSDAEVGIVKSEYNKIIKKYVGKTITPERVNKLISELEKRLEKHACSKTSDKLCVNCTTNTKCIFHDVDKMKKQFNCTIIHGQPRFLQTRCHAGDMGAPLVGKGNTTVMGITFTQNAFFMDSLGMSMATRPNFYADSVNKYLKSYSAIHN